ncbi:uncharacterized protein LOC128225746 [Mya arenaria]|uniref:uncharacterized protein LOC128225746 n=1 Tax=Mya arenaria TaxID=6604 RepID=UPI0022E5170D|nr:uncharacterized protein LOC128225746 [Mya arenaria]
MGRRKRCTVTVEENTTEKRTKLNSDEKTKPPLENPFETLTNATDINVRTEADSMTCHVTAMAMLAHGTLVVVDNENNAIKLIRVSEKRVLNTFNTETSPWDLAVLSSEEIAVTLPRENSVLILKADPKHLIYHETLKMDAHCEKDEFCVGVAKYQDKLLVSFNSFTRKANIKLISRETGEVLEVVPFKCVQCLPHVTVDEEGSKVYVSDATYHKIHLMDMVGKGKQKTLHIVKSTGDNIAKRPTCVLPLSDRNLLVCSNGSNQMLLVSDSLDQTDVVKDEPELFWPRVACYDDYGHRIFVSHGLNQFCQFRDSIKCYSKEI